MNISKLFKHSNRFENWKWYCWCVKLTFLNYLHNNYVTKETCAKKISKWLLLLDGLKTMERERRGANWPSLQNSPKKFGKNVIDPHPWFLTFVDRWCPDRCLNTKQGPLVHKKRISVDTNTDTVIHWWVFLRIIKYK